ncbi:nucleoside recognition domain-containing protein [Calderihabitans maritimus]|uniref:Spore maturation protein A n=1 Tax=Calderihabitans maritimus TaxID=1246530 RepID=A0A1Z5HR11_9FIRM|nr:nucleoside recognition domain-containing protein [Calderihabitans maritimus]GAW91973.1 spore maturation protein A [Calderihabitans maritimus]
MINVIWAVMILTGILFAGMKGNAELVTITIFKEAFEGLITSLELIAIIAVWFGLSRVAEKAGLLTGLARLLTPLLRPLFPSVPPGHSSLGSIAMNLTANLLGLANAATPFGLKAMKELQELNHHPDTVTPAMITFLAINSTCVTLIPATAIALRANAGAAEPSSIIVPAALASGIATITVLALDRLLKRRGVF